MNMHELTLIREENRALKRQMASMLSYAKAYNEPPCGLNEPAIPLPALCPNAMLSGVYFLCLNGVVVYVGQSIAVLGRVSHHIASKEKNWNSVYFIPYEPDALDNAERHWINKLKPFYNVEAMQRVLEKNEAHRKRKTAKATGGMQFVTA